MAGVTLPRYTIEAAFASDPLDASPTWTDITADIWNFRTNRGRQHELNQMEAGTLDFTVAPHKFTNWLPWNTSSPYYHSGTGLRPMKKIRVKGDWNLLTADEASFETSLAGWADTGGGAGATVTRSSTWALSGAWSMQMVKATSSGTMAAVSPAVSIPSSMAGQTFTALASFKADVTPRACSLNLSFYDGGGGLLRTVLGATVNDLTASWVQASAQLAVPAGAVSVVIQTNVAGCSVGDKHWVDCVGVFPAPNVTVWSAGGTYYEFTGHLESVTPAMVDAATMTMQVHAVDGFKVMNLAGIVTTDYHDAVMADTPSGYWRLGENTNSTTASAGDGSVHIQATDSSGNAHHGTFFGSPSFGNVGALVAETDDGTDFGVRQSYVLLPGVFPATGTGSFTVEAWVYPRSFPAVDFGDRIWSMQLTASQLVDLYVRLDGSMRLTISDGTNGGTLDSSSSLTLHRWNHVVAVKSGAIGSFGWKIFLNGVDVSGSTGLIGTGAPNLTAYTTMIAGKDPGGGGVDVPAFDGVIDEFAFYDSALTSVRAAAHFAAAHGLTAGSSLAGALIGNLLDLCVWPAGDRVLDTGQFQLQGIGKKLTGTKLLAYLSLITDSEGYPSAVFMDGQGRLVFQDRAHSTPSSSGTFGDGAGELHPASYDTFQPALDDLDLWNEIVMQAEGGAAQTASDSTSQTAYVKRTLPPKTNLLNASDTDVATMAAAELARYKDPAPRLKMMTIMPASDPGNLFPLVLGLDIGGRIAVNQHTYPGTSDALTLDLRIEGVQHEVDFQTASQITRWALVPT